MFEKHNKTGDRSVSIPAGRQPTLTKALIKVPGVGQKIMSLIIQRLDMS